MEQGDSNHADDTLASSSSRVLHGMQNISRLAPGILTPDTLFGMIAHVGKVNGRIGGIVCSTRGDPNDPNRILWCYSGCFNKKRMKKVSKKEMTEVVNSQLEFVALDRLGSLWGNHHSSIVPENIQSRFASKELLRRCFDGSQIIQLQGVKQQLARWLGVSSLDFLDYFCGFALAPCCQINLGVVLVQDCSELLSKTAWATSNYEDLQVCKLGPDAISL